MFCVSYCEDSLPKVLLWSSPRFANDARPMEGPLVVAECADRMENDSPEPVLCHVFNHGHSVAQFL